MTDEQVAATVENERPTRLRIIQTIGYALVAVVLAVIMSGIQGNRAAVNSLEQRVDKLEDDLLTRIDRLEDELEADIATLEKSLESEIARLDESNRNRRDSIAELQVATSANETALYDLRRDVERLLPPGTDSRP